MAKEKNVQNVANQTVVLQKLQTSSQTPTKLETLLGRSLGNPISGMPVGKPFNVTLTGEIQISSYNDIKSAHFLTNEGIKIKVNASFAADKFKAETVREVIVNEVPMPDTSANAAPDAVRMVRYASFTKLS